MSDKRAWIKPGLYVVVALVILTAASRTTLRAQSQISPLTVIVDKLDQIIGILTAEPPPPPPGPSSVRLSTPLVYIGVGQQVSCIATNMAPEARDIAVARKNVDGQLLHGGSFAGVVPGRSVLISDFDSQGQRCEFDVAGGETSDIRATMLVTAGAPTTTVVSVDAR
jgi:hypothetical protein